MNLLVVAGIFIVAVGVYALTWSLVRKRDRSHAETREDVLKQAYHLREKRRDVTLESVAGALHRQQDDLTAVVSELGSDGLIETRGDQLRLTEEGTTAALKLIRSHRLWERYLAEETGVGASRWHQEAEKQEHLLTTEDADALARRLGHPMYDPHGDPIPQKDLELPVPRGRSLATATMGEEYLVIHLEDEPATVYNEIVANEIFRGSRLRLLEKDQSHATLECDGKQVRLPLLSLGNITIVPSRERQPLVHTGRRLSDLTAGQEGKVISLSPACRGMQRRRLLDLGILPGTSITAELVSPFGDPVGYRIRGSLVALRQSEADLVNVEREE